MAERIVFKPAPRDPRQELFHKLQKAPDQHVEALLDAYAILQLLRDKGILELAKGALGSGEKVLAVLVETMESEEIVRIIRNLVILLKIVGSLDPEMLEKIVRSTTRTVDDGKTKKPPGFLRLLGQAMSPESRRVLGPMMTALETTGKNLDAAKTPSHAKGKRKMTTRHNA